MRQRGQSQLTSLVNAQTKPIYIDDQTSPRQGRYINSVATISPLPAFDHNHQLTKLLYSKFIVKGVKPFNHQLILSKLKESNQHLPSRKTTRQTTHYTKEAIVRDPSFKRERISRYREQTDQPPIFDFSMERSLHRQQQSMANLNKNIRPSSGFQRSSIKRPQSASMKLLHRPQSAYTSRPVSASSRNLANQRPQSSFERTPGKKKPEYYEYELQKSSNILKISQSNPKIKTVDFIQKNKREASSKKKSIYLTVSEVPNHSKLKSGSKAETDREARQQPSIKRQTLTKAQKDLIAVKQREYLQYMKENMPLQYQQCVEFLLSQDQNGEEESNFIISCSLGQQEPISMNSKEIEDFQVQYFYKDFLNKCLTIEHNIKQTEVNKQQPQPISTILNCDQTDQIIELFTQIQELRQNDLNYDQQSTEIRNIVKNLSFFKQIRKQVLKSVFEMEYQILSFEQNQIVIPQKSAVTYVYIILNGSVSKQNTVQKNESMLLDQIQPPQYLTTLFDGEIFGLPGKNNDNRLHYSIKTIERCLFMLLPYDSYRLALSSNQNIEDRIELLEQIFPSRGGKYRLSKQDYETIAYQMETTTYAAQEVIVREGERRDELMLVASGNAAICFQSVIKRKKENLDPLLKNRKQIIKEISISELRRSNLVNYSLLFQNAFEKHYYLNQIVETKIRGDVLNWKNFHQCLTANEQEKVVRQQPLEHSLISTHDNTKVYVLAPSKVGGLSEHIQQYISQKAQQNSIKVGIKRDQQSIDKWEAFKIKICKEILAKKGRK